MQKKLTLNDGSNYSFDAADSLLGRAGLAFGMSYRTTRATCTRRFPPSTNSWRYRCHWRQWNRISLDGKDTWIEYGLGANFNLTDSTYIWADVERTSGGALDKDYRATLGVRYAW